MNRPFELRSRLKSFQYAFRGLAHMLATQHNAWIHAFMTLAVLAAGLVFSISAAEWCWLILAMTSVWTAEAMNTAFELLCDATTKDFHPVVGQAKDVAAGAVLLTAIGALLIGLVIFVPHLSAFVYETGGRSSR